MSNETQFDYEKALHDLRVAKEALDSAKGLAADQKEALKREYDAMNLKLDKQSEANQKLMADLADQKAANDKAQMQIDLLEKQVCRMGSGSKEYAQKSEGIAALENFVGHRAVNEVTRKYLRTDSNVEGGFMVRPEDVDSLILKPITEINRIRSYARVRKIDTMVAASITRDTLMQVYRTHEGAPRTPSNSTYGKLHILPHSQSARIIYTREMALSSNFNLQNEIQADALLGFAQLEGQDFVNGDGINAPTGFMTGTVLTRIASGIAGSFDWKSLVKLTGALKTGYAPVYGFTRVTEAYMRTLTDPGGRYIWLMGGSTYVANMINGYPYVLIPGMPDYDGTTVAKENVVFADFARMYQIVDAFSMQVTVDPYSMLSEGKWVMQMDRWVGGGVQMPEAGVILSNKVS